MVNTHHWNLKKNTLADMDIWEDQAKHDDMMAQIGQTSNCENKDNLNCSQDN